MAYNNKPEDTTSAKKTTEISNEELLKRVEALTLQNEMLMKMFIEMQNSRSAAPTNEYASSAAINNEYTIVHLVENAPGLTTHIELSNITMDLSAFGEERLLDRRQAEELAGKYRKFFEKGIIAFGSGGEELASKFGLKSISDYSYINKDFVRRLGALSPIELENLYNKVSAGHKKFIIEYFKRKILERDPLFKDTYKIETLNRVSNGAMSGTTLDLKLEAEKSAENK